ncbi:MAG TPA: extracellular solute-binding protein [Gemmatimonadales bacterium]|nr:extracellular solute-binding protein [Gemmatimonadales bacterium]
MLLALRPAVARAQDSLSGPLVVVSAGSLRAPLADVLALFVQRHPRVVPHQASGGSVEVIRRSRDSVPDVLGSADYALIPAFLIPRYATSYVKIGRNSMVLVYGERSRYAGEVNAQNWPDVLLRRDVRTRRADPALDPGAYRVVLMYRLAERFFKRPGLAARLEAAAPIWMPKPGDDVYAQLAGGEFDYLWSYKSQAVTRGLRFVELPPELNLGDSTLTGWYASASLKIPRELGSRGGDSIEIHGEPIQYGVTIPTAAPHRRVAEAFVALLLSDEGKAVFRRHGFVVP